MSPFFTSKDAIYHGKNGWKIKKKHKIPSLTARPREQKKILGVRGSGGPLLGGPIRTPFCQRTVIDQLRRGGEICEKLPFVS